MCIDARHVPHDAYQWVMSHMSMRHVTYAYLSICIVPHMYRCATCPTWCTWMSHVTRVGESCQWVISRIHINVSQCHVAHTCRNISSHVMHINESCHTCRWVMSMRHVTHTYQCVMSQIETSCHTWCISLSHVTQVCELCPKRHVTHVCELCPKRHVTHDAYQWVMSRSKSASDTHQCVMSRMNESCHRRCSLMRHVTQRCYMSMRHVSHANESSHAWMNLVIEGVLSCQQCWTISHKISRVTLMEGSCHSCEWVMS